MPYIDFGNSKPPVKEDKQENPIDCSCENCIHRVFIPGGLYRCSITNKYMMHDFKNIFQCVNKDTNLCNRKIIVGLFTYNENGESSWTGALTVGNIKDIDDGQAFTDIINTLEKDFYEQYPKLQNMAITHCIIAESRNDEKFVGKTKLLPQEVVDKIIDDTNKKFL